MPRINKDIIDTISPYVRIITVDVEHREILVMGPKLVIYPDINLYIT
jgi:hypothetical protein